MDGSTSSQRRSSGKSNRTGLRKRPAGLMVAHMVELSHGAFALVLAVAAIPTCSSVAQSTTSGRFWRGSLRDRSKNARCVMYSVSYSGLTVCAPLRRSTAPPARSHCPGLGQFIASCASRTAHRLDCPWTARSYSAAGFGCSDREFYRPSGSSCGAAGVAAGSGWCRGRGR